MENRINQIITLTNGNKFMILHQAIYDNHNYYVCCAVTPDETKLNDDFMLFEESKKEDKTFIKLVEDPSLAKFILQHLDLMDKDED